MYFETQHLFNLLPPLPPDENCEFCSLFGCREPSEGARCAVFHPLHLRSWADWFPHCARRTAALLFLFPPSQWGVACQLSTCARRSRPFRGRAIRDFSPYHFRSWANWFPTVPVERSFLSPPPLTQWDETVFSQLRASSDHRFTVGAPRAKRVDRLIPSPPTHDDESSTTHPRCVRRDLWLTPLPVAVRQIDGW